MTYETQHGDVEFLTGWEDWTQELKTNSLIQQVCEQHGDGLEMKRIALKDTIGGIDCVSDPPMFC